MQNQSNDPGTIVFLHCTKHVPATLSTNEDTRMWFIRSLEKQQQHFLHSVVMKSLHRKDIMHVI